MTPEEELVLAEAGETPEAIAEKQAADAEVIRLAAEQKTKDDAAAKEALLLGLTPEDVEKTPHFRKMAYSLQEERRQERTERLRFEQENQRLIAEATVRAVAETDDPDAVLTVGEFNRRVDAKVAQLAKDAATKQMQDDAVSIQYTLAISEEKARAELTVEKTGAGLDYDSVFAACQRQVAENPAYAQVILKSKDPAREAYRIGLLDPAIQTLRDARQTEVTLTKIKTGGGPPKVGGGSAAPGAGEDLSMEELLNLSPAELEKRTIALEQQGG